MIKIFIFSFTAILLFSCSTSRKIYKRVNVNATSKNTVTKEIILYNSKNEDSIRSYESKSLGTTYLGFYTGDLNYREVRPGISYGVVHYFYDSINERSYEIQIKVDPEQQVNYKTLVIVNNSDQQARSVTYALSDNILDYYKRKVKEEFKSDKDPDEIPFPPAIEKYIGDTVDFVKHNAETNCTSRKRMRQCNTRSETEDCYIELYTLETDSLLLTDSLERYKDINLLSRKIIEINKFTGDTNMVFTNSVTCIGDDICEKRYLIGETQLNPNKGHFYMQVTNGYITYGKMVNYGRNFYIIRDQEGIIKSGYAYMENNDGTKVTEKIVAIDERGRPTTDWAHDQFSTYPFKMFPDAGIIESWTNPDKLLMILYNTDFLDFINYYTIKKGRKYKIPKQKAPYSNAKVISKDRRNKSEIREQEHHGIVEKIEIFYR